MTSLRQLVHLLLALFCITLPFSFIRRHGGRKRWVQWAPVVLILVSILLLLQRSGGKEKELDFVIEDDFIYQQVIIEPPQVHFASLKSGITVHVTMMLVFVGLDPHASANAKDTVTWVVVYSTAPVHFHVITDDGSVNVIEQIMKRAERQANCPFTFTVETVDTIFDQLMGHLHQHVPHLKMTLLQEHVVTRMLPLILPWHFEHLDRIVYLNSNIKFRTDVVELYEHFQRFQPGQVMGLTLTQSGKFARALGAYRHLQTDKIPDCYVGLDPPQGWPGFNTDLMLLDLRRMRESPFFRRYVDLENQFHVIKKYEFNTRETLPSLDEWLTMVALEKPQLFLTLPCQWNVQVDRTAPFRHCVDDVKAMEFSN